ncbi:TetR/AcrR family transcriptional regulator C-terminal domain-containing protein [Streptomyces sp. NPDC058247]|uniref:TetR/AcrR family transcriptional regulator C-terminal domain-containing protein n=1 Tax=Streptomyces sp. NPDC058247 TaxID=3346401 RepID=UPI0036E73AFA
MRWHAENMRRLLVLMSDAIFAGLDAKAPPEPWEDRVLALARWCREAVLAHRDAARLIAGLATTEANTYRFADAMIQALLDAGFPPRTAAWANWTVFYLILGITQEQQAESTETAGLAAAFDDAEFPALRAASAYITAGTFDERFEFALGMQVTVLKAELGRTVPASGDGD